MNPTTTGTGETLVDQEASGAMAHYGIARRPIDYFHYKDYRYTSLTNAVAQARRDEAPTRIDDRGAYPKS